MTDINKDPVFLKASLRELVKRLAYPGAEDAISIIQTGKVAEALLYLMSKVEELEKGGA